MLPRQLIMMPLLPIRQVQAHTAWLTRSGDAISHLPAEQHLRQVLQVLRIGGVAGVHVAAGGADGGAQVGHLGQKTTGRNS